jgi:hypothetical protein
VEFEIKVSQSIEKKKSKFKSKQSSNQNNQIYNKETHTRVATQFIRPMRMLMMIDIDQELLRLDDLI